MEKLPNNLILNIFRIIGAIISIVAICYLFFGMKNNLIIMYSDKNIIRQILGCLIIIIFMPLVCCQIYVTLCAYYSTLIKNILLSVFVFLNVSFLF